MSSCTGGRTQKGLKSIYLPLVYKAIYKVSGLEKQSES
jgi:hypothetical protein